MLLNDRLNEFNDRLSACDELSECKIMKAYPYSMKQGRLNQIAIATSIGEIDAENIEVGGSELYGAYKINAYIYAPYKNNELMGAIAGVVRSQLEAYPSSISVSEIMKNDDLECVYVKCSMTFYDDLNFGGSDDE